LAKTVQLAQPIGQRWKKNFKKQIIHSSLGNTFICMYFQNATQRRNLMGKRNVATWLNEENKWLNGAKEAIKHESINIISQ